MIRRELASFLVVGTLTVAVDFLTYRGLATTSMLPVAWAKGVGFLTGTVFAYHANRVWTFGHKPLAQGSGWRFAGLYAATLATNVAINGLVLCFSATSTQTVRIAFLAATCVSAALNFVGMKLFVFRARNPR